MSQKMLRKSLTNGGRKQLDSFNRELAHICKIGLGGTRPHVKSKRKKIDDDQLAEAKEDKPGDEEMKQNEKKAQENLADGAAKKAPGEKASEEVPADKDVDMLPDAEDDSDGHDQYELDMYADEGESMSHDSDASIERHAAIDSFKASAPQRILDSGLPEDQQTLLVKLMSRQHNFLIGFLHTYAESQTKREEDEGSADGEHDGEEEALLIEDEVYALQCRIDEFQQCMEEIEERFLMLRQEKQAQKAEVLMGKVAEENPVGMPANGAAGKKGPKQEAEAGDQPND